MDAVVWLEDVGRNIDTFGERFGESSLRHVKIGDDITGNEIEGLTRNTSYQITLDGTSQLNGLIEFETGESSTITCSEGLVIEGEDSDIH